MDSNSQRLTPRVGDPALAAATTIKNLVHVLSCLRGTDAAQGEEGRLWKTSYLEWLLFEARAANSSVFSRPPARQGRNPKGQEV